MFRKNPGKAIRTEPERRGTARRCDEFAQNRETIRQIGWLCHRPGVSLGCELGHRFTRYVDKKTKADPLDISSDVIKAGLI
jgi:hypothetical protein